MPRSTDPESGATTGLTIVTAGRTGPNRSVRFGDQSSLDDRGRRDVTALAATLDGPPAGSRCGPEPATRESADILGITEIDAGLATLDVGDWAGLTPEEVGSDALARWFTEPTACPHGGETIADFVARIGRWRRSHRVVGTVLVAMPVAQALLCTDAAGYFATQVRPSTRYLLATDPGC